MGTESSTVQFLSSIGSHMLGLLTAAVLLGLAIATVRALTAWRQDQRESFSKYRSDAFRILAVGVVGALIIGNAKIGDSLKEALTKGLSVVEGSTGNSLSPETSRSDSIWNISELPQLEFSSNDVMSWEYGTDDAVEGSAEELDEVQSSSTWNSNISDENWKDFVQECAWLQLTSYDDIKKKYKETQGQDNSFYSKCNDWKITTFDKDEELKKAIEAALPGIKEQAYIYTHGTGNCAW